jgi:hypothetical protein
MVTDIVGSTAGAPRMGDVAWKALLALRVPFAARHPSGRRLRGS